MQNYKNTSWVPATNSLHPQVGCMQQSANIDKDKNLLDHIVKDNYNNEKNQVALSQAVIQVHQQLLAKTRTGETVRLSTGVEVEFQYDGHANDTEFLLCEYRKFLARGDGTALSGGLSSKKMYIKDMTRREAILKRYYV